MYKPVETPARNHFVASSGSVMNEMSGTFTGYTWHGAFAGNYSSIGCCEGRTRFVDDASQIVLESERMHPATFFAETACTYTAVYLKPWAAST